LKKFDGQSGPSHLQAPSPQEHKLIDTHYLSARSTHKLTCPLRWLRTLRNERAGRVGCSAWLWKNKRTAYLLE
jgi:hypothetical protein